MKDLHVETRKMIRQQLVARYPLFGHFPEELDDFVRKLQRLCVEFDVPIIECLFAWIQEADENNPNTLEEWRAQFERYRQMRETRQ